MHRILCESWGRVLRLRRGLVYYESRAAALGPSYDNDSRGYPHFEERVIYQNRHLRRASYQPPAHRRPALSLQRSQEILATPRKCLEQNVALRGALNDGLRAVLGEGWGVGYTYMYIKCHGDRAPPPPKDPSKPGRGPKCTPRLDSACEARSKRPIYYSDVKGLFGC